MRAIYAMPLRTLFLLGVVTFVPWAVPFVMPIPPARVPWFGLIAWTVYTMAGGDYRRIRFTKT